MSDGTVRKKHRRLLFYLRSQYLGHLNWVGSFPESVTFQVDGAPVELVCEGSRDWQFGREAVYTERGMPEERRRQVASGCRRDHEDSASGSDSLSDDDIDFLGSQGIRW